MSKASKLLEKLADHLTDPNGEILLAAEHDQDVLNIVSFSLAKCAEVLKETARDILKLEGHDFDGDALEEMALVASELDGDVEFSKYSESIDNVLDLLSKKDSDISVDLENIVNLATAFDESGDPELGKKASVLDEILLTIGAPKGENYTFKAAEEAELIKLREKYRAGADKFYGVGKERTDKIADESNKVIKEKVRQYKPNEHALSSRYSPDMPGVSLMRIADGVWQDPITKKIYNYEAGYTLDNGSKVPGSSISQQTQNMADNVEQKLNFSTRDDQLNS